jgi:hypothetical protein
MQTQRLQTVLLPSIEIAWLGHAFPAAADRPLFEVNGYS